MMVHGTWHSKYLLNVPTCLLEVLPLAPFSYHLAFGKCVHIFIAYLLLLVEVKLPEGREHLFFASGAGRGKERKCGALLTRVARESYAEPRTKVRLI